MLGAVIIVGGFVAAGSNWYSQDVVERQARARQTNDLAGAAAAEPLPPDDSRRYTHDVEMYYGKTGMLLDSWTRVLESWTHGKRLSVVIAIGSLVVAGGCFFLEAVYSATEERETESKPHQHGVDSR
jgi:hypothetical protein